ncbi:MAG: hypothetical protein ABIH21_05740 [Patescibacteria group bacterium]
MKIVIVASLDFIPEIKHTSNQLQKMGHDVIIPMTAKKVISGEATFDQIMEEKQTGEIAQRAIRQNVVNYYYKEIQNSDAILILNFDKKGVAGYVGGGALMEMAFAFVLKKKIFLYNPIPNMDYTAEIESMQPIVIHTDLALVQ